MSVDFSYFTSPTVPFFRRFRASVLVPFGAGLYYGVFIVFVTHAGARFLNVSTLEALGSSYFLVALLATLACIFLSLFLAPYAETLPAPRLSAVVLFALLLHHLTETHAGNAVLQDEFARLALLSLCLGGAALVFLVGLIFLSEKNFNNPPIHLLGGLKAMLSILMIAYVLTDHTPVGFLFDNRFQMAPVLLEQTSSMVVVGILALVFALAHGFPHRHLLLASLFAVFFLFPTAMDGELTLALLSFDDLTRSHTTYQALRLHALSDGFWENWSLLTVQFGYLATLSTCFFLVLVHALEPLLCPPGQASFSRPPPTPNVYEPEAAAPAALRSETTNLFVSSFAGVSAIQAVIPCKFRRNPSQRRALICGVVFFPLLSVLTYRSLYEAIPLWFGDAILLGTGGAILGSVLFGKRHGLRPHDRVMVGGIAACFLLFGLGYGLLIGTLVAVIDLARKYSKTNFVQGLYAGTSVHSQTSRSHSHTNILFHHGHHIQVLVLCNHLFQVQSEKVHQILDEILYKEPQTQWLVLDFTNCASVETHFAASVSHIAKFCAAREITLMLSVPNRLTRFKKSLSELVPLSPWVQHFQQFNQALSSAEDRLIDAIASRQKWTQKWLTPVRSLSGQSWRETNQGVWQGWNALLRNIMPTPDQGDFFFSCLIEAQFARGDSLTKGMGVSDKMFFIERGTVTLQAETPHQKSAAFLTIKAGAVVGEIGFLLNQPRSATVQAAETTNVFVLNRVTYDKLYQKEPDLIRHLKEYIILQLAGSLIYNNSLIRSVFY